MILNSFVNRNKYVEYKFGGTINDCGPTDNPNGLYELIENTIVAFYCENSSAFVQVGEKRFSISDLSINLSYDGQSVPCRFEIKRNEQLLLEFKYKPWWDRRPPEFIAAFGQPDDEEEDLLAYISMMSSKSDTRAHLINVYSGNYSEPAQEKQGG